MTIAHRIRLISIAALTAFILSAASPRPAAIAAAAEPAGAHRLADSRGHRDALHDRRRSAGGRGEQLRRVSAAGEDAPRVGALLDPDLERILSLRPDLVIVYESQTDFRRQLERAGVPMYVYKHAGLADVLETMQSVGARVGRKDEAAAAVTQITDHLARIRARVQGRARPTTLLVFGRDALALRGIYASGGVGFLNDMLSAAGGANVFGDVQRQSVQATTELILARHPDVIVEFRAGAISDAVRQREIGVWGALAALPAVKNRRITILTDQRTVVPGPRVAEGTELIARVLHPEAFVGK